MYQNYIFDLYGTLVDIHTDEECMDVWEKLALFYGYYGALYSPQELKRSYKRLVGEMEKSCRVLVPSQNQTVDKMGDVRRDSHEANPEIQIEEVFSRLYTEKGIQPEEGLAVHAGQFFRVLSTEYVRLYDGAVWMLEAIRRKGGRIYLLSNAQRIFTQYELQMLDIARYFDGIMISSDYGVKKPDPRFFEMLMETYHITPQDSIMIGNDGTCDIAGGKNAGLDTFYIHSNISPEYKNDVQATYLQMEMDYGKLCRILGIL